MINDNTALIKASLIVICFEGGLITAMVVLNAKFQGLLKGWGFTLLFLIGMAEIFMASTEIQSGIMKAGASAEFVQQSASNTGSIAASMSDATKGIADCNKRYPRKNKDAVARDNCVKPFNAVLKSSAGALPNGDAPKFNSEDAGKLKIWQSVADTMNEAWQPEVKITWERAAFYCMTAIMALFVLVKNFLWAAYSREMALKHDAENDQAVTIPEHAIGNPASVAESIADNDAEPEAQPAKMPFGFTGSKSPAASSADRNRAMQTVEKQQVHDRNTGYRNTGNDRVRDTVDGKPYTGNDRNTGIRYTGIEAVKAAKVGQAVNCPVCGTTFVKANKWHLFCSNSRKKKADGTSCADTYYNAENPDRLRAIKRK
ncbi:MAG: hypothetical protein ACKO0Z_05560 [Betaproteobacteria bacterium]